MKATEKKRYLKMALAGLPAVAIMLGLASGSVLAVEVSQADYDKLQAHKKKEAEQNLPPDQQSAPAHPAYPAGPPAGNLAGAATNPVANLMQFQVQDAVSSHHNASDNGNVATLQAVLPVNLPWEAVPLLITRTTMPFVTTPDLGPGINSANGLGDAEALFLFTPKLKTKGVAVGLGFNSSIPTAGDNDFTGSGKWEAGPSALYLNMQTPGLQWGMFAYQLWNFADATGGSEREDVSALSLQPILTQHFAGGWYIATPDTPQTYNFKTNKWTLALGGQVGRVTRLGKQSVKLFGEVLYNPIDDNGPTSEWTAKVNITFLFPK